MQLIDRFQEYIKEQHLFQKNDFLLVAVSGGVDSVVLCELLHRCGYSFSIAHCNFQLRGEESNRDEDFVTSLSEKYNAGFFLKKFETAEYADSHKVSIQVAARELRYQWFEEILSKEESISGGKYILTAHHLNDSIETMLMNFFKGTGIKGLQGIVPRQNHIVRPLLFCGKNELLDFAHAHQCEFVEDSSNSSDKYTRNFFRHRIIPLLEELYPKVQDNLENNLHRLGDVLELYSQSIEAHKRELLDKRGEEIFIPINKLIKHKPLPTIIYEIIKDFGFTHRQVDDVLDLLKSETGKYQQSPSHKIIKNRDWLIISPNENLISTYFSIEKEQARIQFPGGILHFSFLEKLPIDWQSQAPKSVFLDAEKIDFPLLLRRWKTSDYFYPFGMNRKKKKVGKFLSDERLSPVEKEKIWVLQSGLKIMWVVGKRIDERFKITPQTKQFLKITIGS